MGNKERQDQYLHPHNSKMYQLWWQQEVWRVSPSYWASWEKQSSLSIKNLISSTPFIKTTKPITIITKPAFILPQNSISSNNQFQKWKTHQKSQNKSRTTSKHIIRINKNLKFTYLRSKIQKGSFPCSWLSNEERKLTRIWRFPPGFVGWTPAIWDFDRLNWRFTNSDSRLFSEMTKREMRVSVVVVRVDSECKKKNRIGKS